MVLKHTAMFYFIFGHLVLVLRSGKHLTRTNTNYKYTNLGALNIAVVLFHI